MELAKFAMPAKRDIEAEIRICIASAALCGNAFFVRGNGECDSRRGTVFLWDLGAFEFLGLVGSVAGCDNLPASKQESSHFVVAGNGILYLLGI
jgi:hypothetical protein